MFLTKIGYKVVEDISSPDGSSSDNMCDFMFTITIAYI